MQIFMQNRIPYSIIFFGMTIPFFLVQMTPIVGVFISMMGMMFVSIPLINGGMIGLVVEVAIRRISVFWLIIPLGFYGLYFGLAFKDEQQLKAVAEQYARINASADTQFNPDKQALIFDGDASPGFFIQNYTLPVVYLDRGGDDNDGYQSIRLADRETCTMVGSDRALTAAHIYTFGFHENGVFVRDFCQLIINEKPKLPEVRIKRTDASTILGDLPIKPTTTTISMADGREFILRGGTASPRGWIPMPIMGCYPTTNDFKTLDFKPKCEFAFWRNHDTTILRDYGGDSTALANALDLKPFANGERHASEGPDIVRQKLSAIEEVLLQKQLQHIDALSANPMVRQPEWDIFLATKHPELLAKHTDNILMGLERATTETDERGWRPADSIQILGNALAAIPDEEFRKRKGRILKLFANSSNDNRIWLNGGLIIKLSLFGKDAVPTLTRPGTYGKGANDEDLISLCVIGPDAKADGAAYLMRHWNNPQNMRDHRTSRIVYIAMKRIGIEPPANPLVEPGNYDRIVQQWSEVSARSPESVCYQ